MRRGRGRCRWRGRDWRTIHPDRRPMRHPNRWPANVAAGAVDRSAAYGDMWCRAGVDNWSIARDVDDCCCAGVGRMLADAFDDWGRNRCRRWRFLCFCAKHQNRLLLLI